MQTIASHRTEAKASSYASGSSEDGTTAFVGPGIAADVSRPATSIAGTRRIFSMVPSLFKAVKKPRTPRSFWSTIHFLARILAARRPSGPPRWANAAQRLVWAARKFIALRSGGTASAEAIVSAYDLNVGTGQLRAIQQDLRPRAAELERRKGPASGGTPADRLPTFFGAAPPESESDDPGWPGRGRLPPGFVWNTRC